ncbi:MAG: redoxin domain-containing protein [Planctomycetota bacterium]|jgi:hypothetical protein
MRTFVLSASIAIGSMAVASPAIAGEDERPAGALRLAPVVEDPRPLGIGVRVEDLRWAGTSGKPSVLSGLDGARAVVICMFDPACPVSKRYAPRLGRLQARLAKRKVELLVCNSAGKDGVEGIRAAAKSHRWPGTVIADPDAEWAASLGARSTTEVFLLDASRTLRYRGALDDQYGVGYSLDTPRLRLLESAVEDLLAGREIAVEATSAPGCKLKHEPHPSTPTKVTWHNRVSRIFQRSCMGCHREGESGPFPLTTASEVRRQAGMVEYMVSERAMPPWFATEDSLPMVTDHSLGERERTDVITWLKGGMPEGDAADAPAPRKWPSGWRIGEPDLVVKVPEQSVPAEGTVPYRYMMVPVPLKEDRWVRALEVRVSAPEVVHHVLVFLKYPQGHPRAKKQRRYQGGLEGYFAAMVPGEGVLAWRPGRAKFLPAGAVLVFQVHYTTNGTATRDTPSVGMIFADGPPEEEVRSQGVYNTRFSIPPGAKRHPVSASWTFRRSGSILAFMPHMHVRGAGFRYELELPGEERKTVLDVPRYDFNWQLVYRMRKPLNVPRGTRIHATGWFDNSKENPANPDSSKTVRFGEQTWEEMMIGYFEWVPDPLVEKEK